MAKNAIKWSGDMQTSLRQMGPRAKRGMVVGAHQIATEAEAYMKSNASWTDQTGNARNGLKTQVVVNKNSVAIILHHSVPYGIWLEVRWSGRYAVIMPTIEVMAPRYMALVGKLVFK